MAKISTRESESLKEYLILTGWIQTPPEKVSLQTNLGNISLQYPFMTARMQCVVGPEMAVAAGRNGILTMIPRSLRDEDKQAVLDANKKAKLKAGEIEFVENPETTRPEDSLEAVVKQVERTGHSVIPITDRFSKLYGVYIHNPNTPPAAPPNTPIRNVMIPMRKTGGNGIAYLVDRNAKETLVSFGEDETRKHLTTEISDILKREDKKFIPIVDENMILQRMAFSQRYDTNYIGVAISTRGEKWQEEMERWGSQADTLTIDSSNACFPAALEILKYAKSKFPDKPFGIGNIIQSGDFLTFAKSGADYIIGGMGVGSICQTGSERGNGRGQMTVAQELARARDSYEGKSGKHVAFVLDGGMSNVKDITIGLAFADLVMLGNHFNKFYEAAARKLMADGQTPTTEENLMRFVETWGEGHPRARLVGMYGMNYRDILSQKTPDSDHVIERYGHTSLSGATVEGVAGTVEYRGRLRPGIERDARYIRTTISNTGAVDLQTFRKEAILERASQQTLIDMLPHDIEVKEK